MTGFDGLKADVKATLTVTDIAGNTSQREITLKCDTTAPLLRDDFKVSDKSLVTEAGEKDWFKMATLPFSGSYTEAGSGIEHVEYTVVKAGESTGSTGTFSTTKGTGDNASVETFRANLGEFITKLVDGEPVANTVKLVAVDKVGNKSVTKEISLYIDANAPGATADSSETIYTNKEKKFDISG